MTARGAERGSSAALVRGVLRRLSSARPRFRRARACPRRGRRGARGLGSFELRLLRSACRDGRQRPAFRRRAPRARAGKGGPLRRKRVFRQALRAHGPARLRLRRRPPPWTSPSPGGPAVERLRLEPREFGHRLCLVSSGAGHEDLTAEYAAIPAEMRARRGIFRL